MIDKDEIEQLLEDIQIESLKLLLDRIKNGEANATEISTAVKIAREYGLTSEFRKSQTGEVIPGMSKAQLAELPTEFDDEHWR